MPLAARRSLALPVERAWRDEDSNLHLGSVVATMGYDGLGRRAVQGVGDGDANTREVGDWEAAVHTYWDTWSMIETRNGSEQVLDQDVWSPPSAGYVDELLQIARNQDPENAATESAAENLCENFFYVCQDAHYNVLGVTTATGVLIERYETTPYGRRTVYSHGWSPADFDRDGDVDSDDSTALLYAIILGTEDIRYDLNGDGDVDTDDNGAFNLYSDTALPTAGDPLVTTPTLMGCEQTGEKSSSWNSIGSIAT